MNAKAMLSLLYLCGPSLPIGAFAYSQGLAAAIEHGRVRDGESLFSWMAGALEYGLARLDLPCLLRLRATASARNPAAFAKWDDLVKASRETAELYQEELDLGRSLRRLLDGQGLSPAFPLPAEPGYVAMFAAASIRLGLEDAAALTGFAWSWAENQAAAAAKAIPLGQTRVQKVLLAMMDKITAAVETAATLDDAEIGGSLPGLALASCLHETQYSRMFRS
jgi:urease accessory protein